MSKCLHCGGAVPESRSRNKKQSREFCCRAHKDAHGTEARVVGRRVIRVVPERTVRDRMLSTIEAIGPGRVEFYDGHARAARRKRQEYLHLDAMQPQERLGVLCRAAQKYGVM